MVIFSHKSLLFCQMEEKKIIGNGLTMGKSMKNVQPKKTQLVSLKTASAVCYLLNKNKTF